MSAEEYYVARFAVGDEIEDIVAMPTDPTRFVSRRVKINATGWYRVDNSDVVATCEPIGRGRLVEEMMRMLFDFAGNEAAMPGRGSEVALWSCRPAAERAVSLMEKFVVSTNPPEEVRNEEPEEREVQRAEEIVKALEEWLEAKRSRSCGCPPGSKCTEVEREADLREQLVDALASIESP